MSKHFLKIVCPLSTIARRSLKIGRELAKIVFSMYISGFEDWHKTSPIAMRLAKIGSTLDKIEALVTFYAVSCIHEDWGSIVEDCNAFCEDCVKIVEDWPKNGQDC